MISLTRLNGQQFIINADLIETIEARPDTIITLTTGERYIVKETVEEILEMVKHYKQSLGASGPKPDR